MPNTNPNLANVLYFGWNLADNVLPISECIEQVRLDLNNVFKLTVRHGLPTIVDSNSRHGE